MTAGQIRVVGAAAWRCSGCRDLHYMREPAYAGGLCRQCADRLAGGAA